MTTTIDPDKLTELINTAVDKTEEALALMMPSWEALGEYTEGYRPFDFDKLAENHEGLRLANSRADDVTERLTTFVEG